MFLFLLSGDHLFNELKRMRGDADQVTDVRNRRASTFLPSNPLKMAKINNTRFGRIQKCFGLDLIWFGSVVTRFFPRSYFMLKLVPGTLNSHFLSREQGVVIDCCTSGESWKQVIEFF